MSTFIDLHVLQTVPSSNINRDDTGSPKSAIFGGVRRARVSSQAWKRATRRDFETYLPIDDLGTRTRRVVADLIPRIQGLSACTKEEARAMALEVMSKSGIKVEKPKRGKAKDGVDVDDTELSSYLLFVSNLQLDKLAAVAISGAIDKASAKRALQDGNGIEVALFGRMVADDTSMNVDAAVQVAHAISTHAVETEYDYFTAVDDAKARGRGDDEATDAGAGMIGVIEFNSSTLYRYACLNLDLLMENIGDAVVATRAVEAFARSFAMSMPTGKQNTFANNTVPNAVVAQVRSRRPVNLVGAFEDPVVAKPGVSISLQSAMELAREATEIDAAFGGTPSASWVVAVGAATAEALAGVGEVVSLDTLVSNLGVAATAALSVEL